MDTHDIVNSINNYVMILRSVKYYNTIISKQFKNFSFCSRFTTSIRKISKDTVFFHNWPFAHPLKSDHTILLVGTITVYHPEGSRFKSQIKIHYRKIIIIELKPVVATLQKNKLLHQQWNDSISTFHPDYSLFESSQ